MGIRVSLQPKQGLFDWLMENSPASWLGYGGSRGGAKSGAARRVMVRRRLQYPRTSGQIMRRVWDDVEKNHINKMWEEFPDLQPYYKSGSHCIDMPEQLGGGKIFFDSAENRLDVERKSYGPEFMDIFVDQAEQFTEAELVQIKTTCRWPGMSEHACKVGLFFNPGGVSADFLQRIFSTKDYRGDEKPEDYAFVQAYGWDNSQWCLAALLADGLTEKDFYSWDNDTRFKYFISRAQYGQEMNRLPAHLRAGQLMGDFSKFSGQYFSNWDESEHTINAESIIFQPHWPRWISYDWGFGHHAVTLWHTQAGIRQDDGSIKRLVITYRELVQQGLSERAMAEEMCSKNDGDVIQNIYAGHDLWREESKGTKEKAMSAVFRSHGLPSMKHAKLDRVDGWRYMHTALDEREWIITKDCPQLIHAIPTAVFDEKKNNEDILKRATLADDMLDCARYGLFSQYSPAEVSDDVKFKQATSHLTDPTSRNIMLLRLAAERDRKRNGHGQVNGRSMGRFQRYAARHR